MCEQIIIIFPKHLNVTDEIIWALITSLKAGLISSVSFASILFSAAEASERRIGQLCLLPLPISFSFLQPGCLLLPCKCSPISLIHVHSQVYSDIGNFHLLCARTGLLLLELEKRRLSADVYDVSRTHVHMTRFRSLRHFLELHVNSILLSSCIHKQMVQWQVSFHRYEILGNPTSTDLRRESARRRVMSEGSRPDSREERRGNASYLMSSELRFGSACRKHHRHVEHHK